MTDAAPQAAYPETVNVAPDSAGAPGAYAPVGGINKNDWGPKQTMVDSTYFGSMGAVNRFPTLVDVDVTISGHFAGATSASPSDDTGQNTILAAFGAADPYVWVKLLWSGAGGHGPSVKCVVESAKVSAAVAGAFEFSATLKGSAKPVYA